MNAWSLVARREILVKLTDKAFLIGTAATVLILVGLLGFQAWQSGRTTTYDVVVDDAAAAGLAATLAEVAPDLDDGVRIRVREVADAGAAEASVRDEEADAWLRPAEAGAVGAGTDDAGRDVGWELVGLTEVDGDLERVAATAVRDSALSANARAAGTSVDSLDQGTGLRATQLRGDAEESTLREVLGVVFAMLFYIASLLFGITLANSVLEEKQSRLAEMIAAAVPLRQLLAGKIVGNTALAMGQMALYVVVGVVGLSFTDYGDLLPAVSGAIGWFLVFFVAGFVALSALWVAAGSLASRTEDVQYTSGPVTMLVLAIFFGAFFLEGGALTAASFVPPLSAVLMPVRLAGGGVAWWEPLAALALLVLLAVCLVMIAARIYRRALLQTQGKIGYREAWSAEV